MVASAGEASSSLESACTLECEDDPVALVEEDDDSDAGEEMDAGVAGVGSAGDDSSGTGLE